MGAPVLIGAGIGAISSLAMGKNPLQGAILGGVTGGTFGGSGGLGSGFTEGGLFGSAVPDAVGSQALTQGAGGAFEQAITPTESLLSGVGEFQPQTALDAGIGNVAIPDSALMSTDQLMSGVGDIQPQLGLDTGYGVNVGDFTQPMNNISQMDTSNLLGAPQQTMFEKIQSIPNPFSNMSQLDQTALAGQTLEAISPTQQEQAQQVIQPKISAGRPLDVSNTGTGMLDIKVPTFTDEVKKNQIRSLFL